MKDIELARNLMDKENKAIVIVKGKRVIFSSEERGIKPVYTALNELKDEFRGSSAADKAVGKAAAMIYAYAGIKEISTVLISEGAINVLNKTPITYEYEKSVPYIKNRDRSGMCPVETISLKTDNIDELLAEISSFLNSINK
jgi:hypothetical protein